MTKSGKPSLPSNKPTGVDKGETLPHTSKLVRQTPPYRATHLIVVDHLIMTHSEKPPFRLFMKIERIKDAPFNTEEVEVPIVAKTLHNVKEIADHSRKRVIPQISKR